MRALLALMAAVLACLAPCQGGAAEAAYPARPIRLIIAYPPGGSSDVIGRVVGQGLTEALGVAVMIDNRGGGGGAIGTEAAARAAPDGYTLSLSNAATHGVLPQVMKPLPYDPIGDFTPISAVAETFSSIGVANDVPARTIQELVSLAKREPGKLNYGTAGIGSVGQFLGEMLRVSAGVDIVHVPYRGSSQAMNDMLAGRVQIMLDPLVMAEAANGRVRLLAVANARRWPGLPDVPTMQESGFPDYRSSGSVGLLAPAGLDPAIVKRLNEACAQMAKSPIFAERLARLGVLPNHSTPEELGAMIAADLERFARIKRLANLEFE